MKTIIILSTAGALFAGTWGLNSGSNQMSTTFPAAAEAVETAVEAPGASMWVDHNIFFRGEHFLLHFNTPHAANLGVINPDGKFFYIVFPAENASGGLKPLVSSERFVGMDKLRINTAALKADPYVYGVTTNQPVFTKTGTYTFILGDNLHVDDPELLQSVAVYYVHSPRPAMDDAVAAR